MPTRRVPRPATPSSQLVDVGEGLQGPEGTTATIDATGLPNVAALAFDGEGRLWAATAAFSDDGTDAVYLVTGGTADPQRVVSDVHTPLGLLWIDDTLYVASAERVDAFDGFDGTTFSASRRVIDLPDGVGEVNGFARAPDGRIVLGISAPCDACDPTSDLSGAIVSFLPDGSDLQILARNVRAPIGLAYFPGTDDLFVTMNQPDELGDATPGDWLSLVADGQDWRFPECYGQGGLACEGVPSPIAELDAHAGRERRGHRDRLARRRRGDGGARGRMGRRKGAACDPRTERRRLRVRRRAVRHGS